MPSYHDGFTGFVQQSRREAPELAATKARSAMMRAFPEAMIEGHEHLEAALQALPDPDDRHIVAAALHAGAAQIITNNLSDFPADVMGQLQIDVRSADDFIADTLDLPMDSSTALSAVRRMRQRLKRPELTAADLLIRMERNGLGQTAAHLATRVDLW